MVHGGVVAGVVMDLSPISREPLAYERHEVVSSTSWKEQFGTEWPRILNEEEYHSLTECDAARLSVEPVRCEFALMSLRNEMATLNVDVYCNRYLLFALIWKPRHEILKKKRIIVAS